jgi:predicted TIM-barrel fold metal-dependent hydrolase
MSKKQSFEIIDFHIHPFLSDDENLCPYENTVNDLTDLESDLLRAGISKACGCVLRKEPSVSFDEISRLNDEAIFIQKQFENFFVPGIHVNPKYVNESCEELKRMHGLGVRLVGELVPHSMNWSDYYDANFHEIYRYIEQLGMVVNVHTKNDDTLEMAVKAFPDIMFVAAHPGDKNSFLKHLELMKKYDNYFLDLSGTGTADTWVRVKTLYNWICILHMFSLFLSITSSS